MTDFTHLHVHTEYSVLDGASNIKKLVAHVKDLGQTAVAITDHGAMFGVLDFYNEATKAGIKPLIGMEGYFVPDLSVKERDLNHILLLAQDYNGYTNLMKLSTEAYLDGYYYKPRLDRAMLEKYNSGLIMTSGCMASEISSAILEDDHAKARQLIGEYKDIFGDRFYLEVQPRDNSDAQHRINAWLLEESNRNHIKVVATTDAHYVKRADYDMHDTLLCVQTRALKEQKNRFKFDEDTYYIMSGAEVARFFSDRLDVLLNTMEVAERINIQFPKKQYHLPEFSTPDGIPPKDFLRQLALMGIEWRYGERSTTDDVLMQRLEYELKVIHEMGFDNYFLIVWDIIQFAAKKDIWWNVRGSGAGSLVAHCLGITAVDPLANGLFFERFLNPGRKSMPDFDVDFEDVRRHELVNYVTQRYGDDRVAAIATFGTMGAKLSVRSVGRALQLPLDVVGKISSLIPAGDITIEDALKDESLSDLYKSDKLIQATIDEAARLQGKVKSIGTHAAGIIIADRPLVEYLPLARPPTASGNDTLIKAITQFPMGTCEELGLLKVDFLGLSTLTIMKRASELIKERHGVNLSIDNIPYQHTGDHEKDAALDKAFKLIEQGITAGVFQVEGDGMTAMLKDMKPFRFDHIVAAIALYRPGPMQYIPSYIKRMHGEESITYRHPKLEPVLTETYGLMVYQEQIMAMATALFDYTPGDADSIRKAIGKKIHAEMEKHEAIFKERGEKNGIDPQIIQAIWDDTIKFAEYCFNKSHSADYAKLTMQTAYLKAHYPTEYMTALLHVYVGNAKRMSVALDECRRMNIPLLPPNINTSDMSFSIEEVSIKNGEKVLGIRCGFATVKNVGGKPAQTIISARGSGFSDMDDLITRLDMNTVNSRALDSLIKVGAFDDFGDRVKWLRGIENLRKYTKKVNKAKAGINIKGAKQLSIFAEELETAGVTIDQFLDPLDEFIAPSDREMLRYEKDLVGFYITSRPTDTYRDEFRSCLTTEIDVLINPPEEMEDEVEAIYTTIGGEVTEVKMTTTKKGDKMAFLTLTDWHDSAESIRVVVFPKLYQKYETLCAMDAVIVVVGRVDNTHGGASLVADHIRDVTEAP